MQDNYFGEIDIPEERMDVFINTEDLVLWHMVFLEELRETKTIEGGVILELPQEGLS